MLKRLFTSSTRVKLLTIFLMNPDGEFFIRELTRELNEQINSIRRELDNLKQIGLLKSKEKNRKKFYTVNKNFIFYNELKAIISKGLSNKDEITKKVCSMGEIDVLVLSGLFVNKDSNIDLLIVGNINKEKLEHYLNTELETSRPIRFSIMTSEDFKYRRKCKDKFLTDLLEDQENIVSVNNLDKPEN
jgi:hypothetical protein